MPTTAGTVTRLLLVAALVTTLLACGGPDEQARADGAAEPAADLPADEAVAAAVAAFAHAGTARFTSTVVLASVTYTDTGSFSLDPAAQEFTREADLTAGTSSSPDAGSSYEIAGRSVDNGFYLRRPTSTGEPSECWLTGDVERVAAAAGGGVGGAGDLPQAAYVVASARGTSYAGERVRADVDLQAATALVGPTFPAQLGIDPGQARVEATLALEDGLVVGYEISARDLNLAAARAGLTLDGSDRPFPKGTSLSASFDGFGETVSVEVPEVVIDITGDQELAREQIATCDTD